MNDEMEFEQAKRKHVNILAHTVKRRAKLKGVPYAIDGMYLFSIAPNNCPIFKVPLKWGYGGNGSPTNDSPSLDRIIPEKGYVKGNVAWISNKANQIKSDVTEVELYAVADWLKQKRREVINGGARPPVMDDDAFTYLTRPARTPVVNDEAARTRGGY